ncbi:hypothetical protein VNI00_000904 [Paramarasmius palmivorus]|uniref:Nuclear pore complex protein Nup160 n=1 Tax=Paramarasmius palmivorus TaxID=297713 RepID=A0AAW0E5P6_9AGAR
MDGSLLVAAQISSLFPASQAISVPVETKRPNGSFHNEDEPSDLYEHASCAAVLHSPVTGTILLRVLDNGLTVELISLSTNEVPAIRFIFPSAVLPSPAMFVWEKAELHIIAVTVTGSVHRLVLPIGPGYSIWRDQVPNLWASEYFIKNCAEEFQGLVHVHGTDFIVVGMKNGSLLRLETEYIGADNSEDDWTETLVQHGNFLSSLTSYLPSFSSPDATASEIISIATHPWPTDVGFVWTLSRDRVLRLWKPKLGCVGQRTLSQSPGRESSPSPGPHGTQPQVLLEAERQTLLRVFSSSDGLYRDHLYVVAFIPSITSPTSGGSFQLLHTTSGQIDDVGLIQCSRNTAHCHLHDFMIIGNVLYTLWDRQGQSLVERTIIDLDAMTNNGTQTSIWQVASYAPEPELTPAYLEEVLASPGSMTDKFLEVVMRPGMFSTLTLSTAIKQYSDAFRSIPGPLPPQLTTTYSSLAENIAAVVGCTVNLHRDPQTGALQHAKYWNALKRDWEGFIARCREIERGARWPLVLGAQDEGDIIVVERERVSSLVAEDLPIHIRRVLELDQRITDSQYDLLGVLWNMRFKAGPEAMLNLENGLVDVLHQEIAFPFADILQDQANRSHFREALDEGATSWLVGRLQSIDDLDSAVRTSLDVIGGFDMEVKREEDEVELLLPPPTSQWFRGLTASYIATTVNARYDLCLCLVALLLFLSEELAQWDASLLAEVFAVFRGIAILRDAVRQPASTSTKPPLDEVSTADDVVSLLQNMQVSRNRLHTTPTHSLIHRLLAQSGDQGSGLPGAAHRFLDRTGLLQSVSPANATKAEVLFCERLRLLGYFHTSRDIVAWMPRTPGITYVLSRIWLNTGRVDDAAQLLEKLAGCFGPSSAMSPEDREALEQVLPSGHLFDSPHSFYLYIATLFKSSSLLYHEVLFTQHALSCVPPNADTSSLWYTVVKGYTELGMYEDAYAAWLSVPSDSQKRESISHIVYKMCENKHVDKLMTFNFAGLADEVQDALAFKARNADPRSQPRYSHILYSWYLAKGDYRQAALTMYQRARKIQALISNDPSLFLTLANEQLEAYMVSMNALTLSDPKTAWFILPAAADPQNEPRKRRKLSLHASSAMASRSGRLESEVIQLPDVQYDYTLLSAQLDLIQKDPSLLTSPNFLLPPSSIVLRLAQSNRFNLAMATARSLDVDMTDLFAHLTTQCLKLSHDPDIVVQQDTSDWLLTDKVSSWGGSPADRGWRYLRESLKRHDSSETDYKYTKTALETVLNFWSSPPPPWLVQQLEEHHHDYLIRVSLRFGNLEQAIDYTLSLVRKADSQLARDLPKHAASTWLPYMLIDQVLAAGTAQEPPPARLSELRLEVANRVKRMQKLSEFQPR